MRSEIMLRAWQLYQITTCHSRLLRNEMEETPLPMMGPFQDPRYVPDIEGSTEAYLCSVFFYTYIPMIKFSLLTRHYRRLTITNSKIEHIIIYCHHGQAILSNASNGITKRICIILLHLQKIVMTVQHTYKTKHSAIKNSKSVNTN